MRKSTPDFEIHVDPSCLSNSTENEIENEKENTMSPERVSSSQTVVHHDSWGEEEIKDTKVTVEEAEDKESENSGNSKPLSDDVQDKEQTARERQIGRIEAQIHAAARAVVASIEQDHFRGAEDSVLSTQTDESSNPEGTEVTYDGTELTYGDSTEATFESEHLSEQDGGDSSSHHDGDIDDDVFSHSDRSARSSLNSVHDLLSGDENQKLLTSPIVGEEAASSHEDQPMSRIPSATSYMQKPADSSPHTPSKVLARPPFRTPSSVRAMQMSSPTPSLFSSPRSVKRHMPTVSRLGTPTSNGSPSKRTPTRFKKKELPLVLLHVTVLPLQWPYSHLMSSPEVPSSLSRVKDSWRLLQEKLGDTVLERGILLPHPQDSYDILEERLLEALELPVRPRAKILKCGHYMGPLGSETASDEEEEHTWGIERPEERKWCDLCHRDVRLEEVGDVSLGEKRFRIKVYASNGLMRAGAWAAAWKDMERVDVEIEPFVEGSQAVELEHLATISRLVPEEARSHDDGFVDEDVEPEHVHDKTAEEEVLRAEEELRQHIAQEEETRYKIAAEQEEMRRSAIDEERMREVYGHDTPEVQQPQPKRRSSSRASVDDDSLPELLLAAFKLVIRDRKNVAIIVLSLFILILSLRPRTVIEDRPSPVVMDSPSVQEITTTVYREATVTEMIPVVTSIQVEYVSTQSTKQAAPVETVKVVESQPSTPDTEEIREEPLAAQEKAAPLSTANVWDTKEEASTHQENSALPIEDARVPCKESVENTIPPAEPQILKPEPEREPEPQPQPELQLEPQRELQREREPEREPEPKEKLVIASESPLPDLAVQQTPIPASPKIEYCV